jgi:flagellar motor protein MotB
MRNLIIALAVVFYALDLLISIAALGVQTIKSSFEDRPEATGSSSKPVENDHILSNQAAGNPSAMNSDKTSESLETRDSSSQINESALLTTFVGSLFLPGQDVMNSEHSQVVRNLVADIENAIPEYRVLIEGHNDNIPIRSSSEVGIENNLQLSCMRAKAAALTIQVEDISSEFIAIKSYGETHLLAPNNTTKGRAINRRVEIRLLPGDAVPVKVA